MGTNSFRRRVYAGLAALLVLAGGLVLFAYLRPSSPQKLIALAYVQQRTLELRIPNAGYAQIHVQRENGRSQFNKPAALLEAEALIQRRLEEKPEDPELLRQTAEVDLLNRDYQPAIETLSRALRARPNSFYLLVDLASAYFERAEGTSNPADYEAGLQHLGDAIRMDPGRPIGLFNRAVIYERLYLYDRAIADWEQFLKVETDRGWKEEAGQRLAELRGREQKRNARHEPERLTLAQFQEDVKTGQATGIEEYLEVAERRILPEIISPNSSDANYQAATILADELKARHSDPFLADLLVQAGQPKFQTATKLLGQSSSANHSGHHDEAYKAAVRAAALFQSFHNIAGFLAAQFEQAYALQFESRADSCQQKAAANVSQARQRSYVLLEVQLLLEQAICSNMNRQIGSAKILTQRALHLARKQGYQSLYLRGMMELATLESEAGDESSAWAAIQAGLGLYWGSSLPAVRAYSFYTLVNRMAERRHHPNVQFAAALEALRFQNPSSLVEANERNRLGDAAMRVGETKVAEAQLREVQKILATMPQTDTVRGREMEARIGLARLQTFRHGDAEETARALLTSLAEVERLSNRYVEFQYYETLGELKIQLGDSAGGREFLTTAIHVAEDGLRSLRTWQERLSWMDQYRPSYVLVTQLLLRSGDQPAALDTWEHFRTATAGALREARPRLASSAHMLAVEAPLGSQRPSSKTNTLTYAFASDGLIIWVHNAQELHSVYLSVSPRDLRRAAENLIDECARPNSDMSNLRADARYLYTWLIQPASQWLPSSGHLIIEPDGILGLVPMEALIDHAGAYLGTRYTFTVASSLQADDVPGERLNISISDRVLIVAGVRAADGSFQPPPGAMDEALHVAEKFNQASLLEGKDARISRVSGDLGRSAVFHFAGHAGFGRDGAAMLMADGPLGPNQIQALDARGLSALKLAVFSACGTARPTETSETDSLVTEFLQAGAHNVVASRWNVDSVATADFMLRFYATVLSGGDIAEALQTAAKTFRESPERAHPYYWAAFSAFGRA